MSVIGSIRSAELITVRLPLVQPFRTSFSVQPHKDALLIRISASDAEGWGECTASPDPYYSYETNTTARHIIKDYLIPMALEKRQTLEGVLERFKSVRGHNMAKAAVENALLDLISRRANTPLYALLEGTPRKIMSGISIGIQKKTEILLQIIEQAVNRRYHRIKIKIEKGEDIKPLKAVRNAFPDISLMVDANADYSKDDFSHLKNLDKFNLLMIEQPLRYDDLYLHAQLQTMLSTPLCLDESIKSLHDARSASEMKSCRIINIKQGRVGGILNARTIARVCSDRGIPVWSGGMLETGVGRAFNLHLQTLPGFLLPGDISETSRYFHEDIVDQPVVLDGEGYVTVPEGPGTGIQVMESRLKKCQIHREKLI